MLNEGRPVQRIDVLDALDGPARWRRLVAVVVCRVRGCEPGVVWARSVVALGPDVPRRRWGAGPVIGPADTDRRHHAAAVIQTPVLSRRRCHGSSEDLRDG